MKATLAKKTVWIVTLCDFQKGVWFCQSVQNILYIPCELFTTESTG